MLRRMHKARARPLARANFAARALLRVVCCPQGRNIGRLLCAAQLRVVLGRLGLPFHGSFVTAGGSGKIMTTQRPQDSRPEPDEVADLGRLLLETNAERAEIVDRAGYILDINAIGVRALESQEAGVL